MNSKKPNRLINQNNPYLLQHAYNLVDWFAWSEEAFDKAKKENKPIFLSIGYSTCHWCHVMEKESFEDEDVAKILNENYISIKVDREERPDIDSIYMTICQMLTGSGGWPLTIIMTPDKEPFFAGTYFPKRNAFGRPGLIDILLEVANRWKNEKDKLVTYSKKITQSLNEYLLSKESGKILDKEIFQKTYNILLNKYDPDNGGFGNAPKFPTPHILSLLLRMYYNDRNQKALEMVENTLVKMRLGGIYDHIGFGFHRYSTDEKWQIPHFEKMLYDQALLIIAYCEAFLITKKEVYAEIASEIITYVLRDMLSPEKGFYTAQDADSEGIEGKFYLWSYDEISNALNADDLDFVVRIYNIKKDGNINGVLHGHKEPVNLIYLIKHPEQIARELNLESKEFYKRLEKVRKKLYEIREKRVTPYKDDKILTDLNALMITALAIAYRTLNKQTYLDAAKNATDFILENMISKNGALFHRYRNGNREIEGLLDDYVFFVWALLELYQSCFEIKYLKEAIRLTDFILEHFLDEKGGFFLTPDFGEKLIVRYKEAYDGAIPSGNSVALMNLLRIWHITSNNKYKDIAHNLITVFSKEIDQYPTNYAQLLIALNFAVNDFFQVVIVGEKNSQDTQKILKTLNSQFLPNIVVILKDEKSSKELAKLAPYTKDQITQNNITTVYICKNFVCHLPTNNIQTILSLLKNKH